MSLYIFLKFLILYNYFVKFLVRIDLSELVQRFGQFETIKKI